jgi:RNase adaptor protein for sRNA GlmZ degradation
MKNLRWLLHNTELPFAAPALIKAFQSMLGSEQLQAVASGSPNLVIRIFSFSYHIGLPKDDTGHGGGFVFDARSIPNPGREERFRTLTGKDRPVVEYLEQQESARKFLANAAALVEASVSDYQRRGFKSLMVSFGCTGGRHRSVYLAEQLAKLLRARNGVDVVVRHLALENTGE